MWLILLSNKAVQLTAIGTLVILLAFGLIFVGYRWGGSGERATQAQAQIQQDIKQRLEDAKRYHEAPINAGNAAADKWLLQRAGR